MGKISNLAVVGLAAACGAGIAIGADRILTDSDGGTTTVTAAASGSNVANVSKDSSGQLTPTEVYNRDAPGVALVLAYGKKSSDNSPFGEQEKGSGSGSGFVIDDKGMMLTNQHVVAGADKVEVKFGDEDPIEAKVVGADESNDFAVLKIDPKKTKLVPLQLGSTDDVNVGDSVVAIGAPFGHDRSLTTGVVSAKKRRIQAPNGFSIENAIQTDASINPGNSGGPLIDNKGKVIAINSQIATSSGGSQGIGFAVPIDTVKKFIPEVEKTGTVKRAFLGVTTDNVSKEVADLLNLDSTEGAVVKGVAKGSPAEKAGISVGDLTVEDRTGNKHQIGGDVIIEINGNKVTNSQDVVDQVTKQKPGDKIKIKLRRGKKERVVVAKLDDRPSAQASADDQQQANPFEQLVP